MGTPLGQVHACCQRGSVSGKLVLPISANSSHPRNLLKDLGFRSYGSGVTLRVQVPNYHIFTQNLYYNYYYPNPKYLIIGYVDPGFKPYLQWIEETVYQFESPIYCSSWVHSTLGCTAFSSFAFIQHRTTSQDITRFLDFVQSNQIRTSMPLNAKP